MEASWPLDSLSRESPDPGMELTSPVSPALAGRFFTTELPGKPSDIWFANIFSHTVACLFILLIVDCENVLIWVSFVIFAFVACAFGDKIDLSKNFTSGKEGQYVLIKI